MYSRSFVGVSLANISLLSSDTSTAVPTAVDLAPYFPVGKREIKFLVNFIPSSTSLGISATATLQQGTSTSTTSFSNVLAADGSTVTWSSTANSIATLTESHALITSRYVRVLYTGATSTGGTIAIAVNALPMVRAA